MLGFWMRCRKILSKASSESLLLSPTTKEWDGILKICRGDRFEGTVTTSSRQPSQITNIDDGSEVSSFRELRKTEENTHANHLEQNPRPSHLLYRAPRRRAAADLILRKQTLREINPCILLRGINYHERADSATRTVQLASVFDTVGADDRYICCGRLEYRLHILG